MIRTFDIELPHGIRLACRSAGPQHDGMPRVLFLHGFPEAAFIWDEVMDALVGKANCLAPNQRGYAGSSAPAEVASYRIEELVRDIASLIDVSGGTLDLLVAHDWGGFVAWALAASRPQLLRRLLIINAPHPAAFVRELRDNPAQQAASRYMNFMARPDAAPLLAADDYARLWTLLGVMGGEWLTPARRERYREVWQQGLAGPAAWYAATHMRPPRSAGDTIHRLTIDDAGTRTPVPTTLLWGERDQALLPCLLDGLERWVPELELIRVPEATHWIVAEQPQLVIALVRRLLDR